MARMMKFQMNKNFLKTQERNVLTSMYIGVGASFVPQIVENFSGGPAAKAYVVVY